jgi:hypothetical protein
MLMDYEVIYDFATEGYWAFKYLQLSLAIAFFAPIIGIALDSSGESELLNPITIAIFCGLCLITGGLFALQSDYRYRQRLNAPFEIVAGEIETISIGFSKGSKSSVPIVSLCIDQRCFVDDEVVDAFRTRPWIKSGSRARIRLTDSIITPINPNQFSMLRVEVERLK